VYGEQDMLLERILPRLSKGKNSLDFIASDHGQA